MYRANAKQKKRVRGVASLDFNALTLRLALKRGDNKRIREITESVGAFNEEEINIAEELAVDNIEKGADMSEYQYLVFENDSGIIGYTCYGYIRGTKNSYDLYWIAVSNELRGMGIGKRLMSETEKVISLNGGGKIYAETSSKESYRKTRQFYLTCGYTEEAVFKDFYDDGDDKVVYKKSLA
ncbi:MAG: GNAT family N-acetyltransferase [Clostridia bacterium]|nr:GNAT family N-acetyltransferase [Clostridia bacterium]